VEASSASSSAEISRSGSRENRNGPLVDTGWLVELDHLRVERVPVLVAHRRRLQSTFARIRIDLAAHKLQLSTHRSSSSTQFAGLTPAT
jgi:hypothetical protein